MAAQLVRLNTIASNLANAGNLASTQEEAYRSLKPVLKQNTQMRCVKMV